MKIKNFVPLVDRFRKSEALEWCPVSKGVLVDLWPNAQCFVMSPEVALATVKLAHRTPFPKELLEVAAPYNEYVVEFPMTSEIAAERGGERLGERQKPVSRVAAHIVVDNDEFTKVAFTPFWEFKDGSVGGGVITVLFSNVDPNIGQKVVIVGATTDIVFRTIPSVAFSKLILHRADKFADEQRKNKYLEDSFRAISEMLRSGSDVHDALCEIPILLFAWLTVLSCKTGVTRTEVPAHNARSSFPGKLGARKTRENSRSAYTLLSITAAENVENGGVVRKSEVDAHLVRGHFKRRKSGIFWWSPFVRGDGEPRKRTAYIVTA